MRKYALFLPAMLLAVFLCLPALADPYMAAVPLTPGDGDMTLGDALEGAKDAFCEAMGEPWQEQYKTGTTACFIELEWKGETRRMWRIALVNGSRDNDTVCAVAMLSPSGEVVDVDQYEWFARRKEWEAEKGPYPQWSVEDKALFYQIYAKMSGDRYADATPQAHDMTREEAVTQAKKALIEQKRADPKELETLMLDTSFQKRLHGDLDDPYQKDFWAVGFVVENPEKSTGYEEVYLANIASPDGEVYMLLNVHEDGPGNG